MKALGFAKRSFYFVKETCKDAKGLAQNPKERLKWLYDVSLYRNAGYLMVNSGVAAILGFAFWIAAARLYSPNDVGLGSALLSVASFLSFIGTLGLSFSVIRYLPTLKDKARFLNSCFTLAGFNAILVAFVFLAGLHLWLPKLLFVRQNLIFFFMFIFFVAIDTLNLITAQVFVAFRRAEYTLIQGIIFGILKLSFVIGFAFFFQVFGIFASWGIATAIALGISLLSLLPRLLPRYCPTPSVQLRLSSNSQVFPLGEVMRFSFANYIGSVVWSLPTWLLPPIVLHILSPEENAYFYIAWATASLLITVPSAISASLFAEGSQGEERLGTDLRRCLKFITLILIPAILAFMLIADKLLLLFGREYSAEGAYLLWLLALASLPASLNLLYLGVARVEKRLWDIVWVSGSIAFGTLLLSYLLLLYLGILGAGVGWLTSQASVAFILIPRLVKRLK